MAYKTKGTVSKSRCIVCQTKGTEFARACACVSV